MQWRQLSKFNPGEKFAKRKLANKELKYKQTNTKAAKVNPVQSVNN